MSRQASAGFDPSRSLLLAMLVIPGTYTISSLSTLVNAIFASGGPTPQGSLRHIQVRRDGATITDFDFYDLLIKGDKSKDVRLLPGDVLYIPHVGPLVAISGSVNSPSIYEMKDNSILNDLIEIAGDLSTVADTNKITIDRFVDHEARKTLEFPYDAQSRALPLQDGDIVRVFSIVPRFEDTVTLRGNVANPGRYPWKPGMRISDLIPNAQALLTRRYWRNRAAIVNGRATEYPVQARHRRRRATAPPRISNRPTAPRPPAPQHLALRNQPKIPILRKFYPMRGFFKSGGCDLCAERAKPIWQRHLKSQQSPIGESTALSGRKQQSQQSQPKHGPGYRRGCAPLCSRD